MVDAARQMLDELMGRNRNLHPSEASKKISWEDPEFCLYYVVKFCPHDLFVNTRADLGPCSRIHDDESRKLYEEAQPSTRKKHYEDEFLRFCNTMLNDVDRKIQKGRQRLQLMKKDHSTGAPYLSKYQEQIYNVEARIKKLVAEAEEAGSRGDVDQARDLMILCDQLREEKEALLSQRKPANGNLSSEGISIQDESSMPEAPKPPTLLSQNSTDNEKEKSPRSDDGREDRAASEDGAGDAKLPNQWSQDSGGVEKQMEVCEICGAFLIVGDAQQRIEDHLMGKQHMGYSKLRNAVAEIYARRQKERDDEERRRHDGRGHRSRSNGSGSDRRRDHRSRERERERDRDRERERERDRNKDHEQHSTYHHSDRHRRHDSKSHHRSGSRSHRRSSRSRSRSHY